jgi:lantibiotic modifying enzyme
MATTLLKPGPLSDEIETGHWRSLLSGGERQMAWETVWEIATVIPSVLPVRGVSPQNPWVEFPKSKIICWKAELALFYAYLAKASGEAEFLQLSSDYLNEAIGEVADQVCSPHLLGGLTEIGCVIAHLAGTGLNLDAGDSCAELDEFLLERLSRADRQVPFDLYTGLTGYGVYALERGPEASEMAVRVVTRLQQTAECNAQGITWRTQAAWLPEWLAQLYPQGVYNLGVAHGVPGVIGFLAQACAIDEVASIARALLNGAVNWIFANRRYDNHGAYFPRCLAPGYDPAPAMHSWCYGELSVGTALLLAARFVGQPDWEREALVLLRDGALRRMAYTEVKEPGICHGTAGHAHLYNRIYQATGEEVFKQAAMCWYARTFDLRTPGPGLAGFQVWNWVERTTSCADLLEGVAGIGLVLMAAVTEVEPQWDRLLLVAVPPRRDQFNAGSNFFDHPNKIVTNGGFRCTNSP